MVLWVPEDELGQVGLDYGDFSTEHRVADTPTKVTFKPCQDRLRTGWPGGLVLKDRDATTLLLQVEGEAEATSLRVGRR